MTQRRSWSSYTELDTSIQKSPHVIGVNEETESGPGVIKACVKSFLCDILGRVEAALEEPISRPVVLPQHAYPSPIASNHPTSLGKKAQEKDENHEASYHRSLKRTATSHPTPLSNSSTSPRKFRKGITSGLGVRRPLQDVTNIYISSCRVYEHEIVSELVASDRQDEWPAVDENATSTPSPPLRRPIIGIYNERAKILEDRMQNKLLRAASNTGAKKNKSRKPVMIR